MVPAFVWFAHGSSSRPTRSVPCRRAGRNGWWRRTTARIAVRPTILASSPQYPGLRRGEKSATFRAYLLSVAPAPTRCGGCSAKLPRHLPEAYADQHAGRAVAVARVRKECELRPILAAYFSEPLLRSLGLAIPFQAEYEGSIPFTRSNLSNWLAYCFDGWSTYDWSWTTLGPPIRSDWPRISPRN